MINRLIYNGKVYYKVADLAQLFDVSLYKMRSRIKKANIGTTLSGFGRMVFVLEENIAKIEVDGQVKVLETEFTTEPVKQEYAFEVRAKETKIRKSKAKKENAENKNKIETSEQKMEKNETPESIEKIQEEHERLIKKGNVLGLKMAKADKFSTTREITEKHLGKGAVFRDATPDDIVAIRAIVEDLEVEVAKLKDSPSETGKIKVSELSADTENVELIESSNENKSNTEQQVGAW